MSTETQTTSEEKVVPSTPTVPGQGGRWKIYLRDLLLMVLVRAILDCVIAAVSIGGIYALALALSLVPSHRLGWLLLHVKDAILVVGGLYLVALAVAALYRYAQVARSDYARFKNIQTPASSNEPGRKG